MLHSSSRPSEGISYNLGNWPRVRFSRFAMILSLRSAALALNAPSVIFLGAWYVILGRGDDDREEALG